MALTMSLATARSPSGVMRIYPSLRVLATAARIASPDFKDTFRIAFPPHWREKG